MHENDGTLLYKECPTKLPVEIKFKARAEGEGKSLMFLALDVFLLRSTTEIQF